MLCFNFWQSWVRKKKIEFESYFEGFVPKVSSWFSFSPILSSSLFYCSSATLLRINVHNLISPYFFLNKLYSTLIPRTINPSSPQILSITEISNLSCIILPMVKWLNGSMLPCSPNLLNSYSISQSVTCIYRANSVI